jgi:tetratricopeptide (TPR) repeat protein/tRNA A-37 threonylcarbamoyl transferase component Bud32
MNEEALFDAARVMRSTAEREAFLDGACGGDAGLRKRVERLLAAHMRAGGILECGPGPAVNEVTRPGPTLAPGSTFAGRFEVLRKLGEGGMGEVWVADQQEPVRRRVALKVIRPGLGSERLLARFDQERQALALMDHPNIAKVLDAGVENSRPYFVMELIEGVPITRYCDEARLSPRERLALFIQVCQAVQHAHQKGVIHRDLKPSNVLVALYDGNPVPKVIDFGIAKATGPKLTEQEASTEVGTIVGTLEYMSPEQADLNSVDVDTRSDVYSLGVVLYELLTGGVPFPREQLRSIPFTEMMRIIREVEPPRPSVRLAGPEALPGVAAARQAEPKRLAALLRGELDWIVMKCLEKDRARRYESANGLARDIERYLRDEAVDASPPGAGYRLRKFARRHRKVLATAAAFVLLLVGGVAVSAWQAVTAMAERDAKEEARQAEAEQHRHAVAEKQRADEEAAITRAVNDFVQKDLLGQADIGNQAAGAERNRNITVRELLDRASLGLEARFQGQERTEAAIRLTLGRAYRALGEFPQAQKHLERSLALRKAKLGPGHADTLQSMHYLAGLASDRGEYGEAVRLYQQVLEARRAARGGDHPDTLQTMNDLGLLYCLLSRYEESEPLLRRALETRRARLGADHLDTLESISSLAFLSFERGRYPDAEPLYKQARDGWRAKLGPDHPHTLAGVHNLANVYLSLGRYDEAELLFDQALTALRAKLGPDDPATLDTMQSLALLYEERGRYDRAESFHKQVLKARRARQGDDHPATLRSMQNFGTYYFARGRYDQAEPLFKEVLAAQRARLPAGHSDTIVTMTNLAVLYRECRRYGEAEPLFREAVAGARKTFGLGHPNTHHLINHLAILHGKQGKPHLAEPLLRELVSFLKDQPGPKSVYYANGLGCLSENLLEQKKYAEAEPFARDCLAIRAKNRPDGWTTFHTRSLLGGALLGQEKYSEAQPLLAEGYAGMKEREAKIPKDGKVYLTRALERLVQLHDARGNKAEAARWRKELEGEKARQKR